MTEAFFGEILATFEEDKVVIEAQQTRAVAGRRQVGIVSDAGGVQARRVMAERLAAEPVGSGASARGNVSPEKIRIAETGTA